MTDEPLDPVDVFAEAERNAQNDEARAFQARVAGDDIAWLMADKRGRRFMRRLLGTCGIWHQSYTPGGSVNDAIFCEGKRTVGLQLLDQIHRHCPDQYTTMNREASHDDNGSRSTRNDRSPRSPGNDG